MEIIFIEYKEYIVLCNAYTIMEIYSKNREFIQKFIVTTFVCAFGYFCVSSHLKLVWVKLVIRTAPEMPTLEDLCFVFTQLGIFLFCEFNMHVFSKIITILSHYFYYYRIVGLKHKYRNYFRYSVCIHLINFCIDFLHE